MHPGIRPVVGGAEKAALDIMRSAGAEPTVGEALEARIAIGLAAPRTVPLIMSAIFSNLAEGLAGSEASEQ